MINAAPLARGGLARSIDVPQAVFYSVIRAKHVLGLDPRMESGSREENASKYKDRVLYRFYEAVKDSIAERCPFHFVLMM
ncbi:hypothetical protein [Nitrobacter sp. TKz-YC01]|uniref:hypothetical protein n=1 Tax=Nitrobacter sp. TKz-YC01 TaxID=3398703 RepID=UPI003A10352C